MHSPGLEKTNMTTDKQMLEAIYSHTGPHALKFGNIIELGKQTVKQYFPETSKSEIVKDIYCHRRDQNL